MDDDVLGTLTKDEHGDLHGNVVYGGERIPFSVCPEGEPLEECLELAKSVVSALSKVDEMAKNAAAKKLLDEYNKGWRKYSTGDGKGDIENDEMTADEFKSTITLMDLEIAGDQCITVWYNDRRLFAGHSIFVTSFDGLAFTDADASLFG